MTTKRGPESHDMQRPSVSRLRAHRRTISTVSTWLLTMAVATPWAWPGAANAQSNATTAARAASARSADYIVAVVNRELVTAAEVEQRMARAQADAQRSGARLPPAPQLRQQVLDGLIDERVLVTHARDSGARVEDSEIDRAVASVAAQNQLSAEQLRERLRRDGIDMTRFRLSLRDQLLVERVREREVTSRIKVSDEEIDAHLAQQRQASTGAVQLNIAQILVAVPEGASDEVVAQRRSLAEQALQRARSGDDFARVARELSQDASKERGGELGLRSADRLPDAFVGAVAALQPGGVAPSLLRTGAGFHVLKLVERRQSSGFEVVQTRARHILLRPSARGGEAAAVARLDEFRQQVQSGARGFEALAREHSQDGSAASGGDLGWASPGTYVPEFEQAMDALPVGGLSQPVVSRFGVHLIQVMERRSTTLDARQLREQVREGLREKKFEAAFEEWLRELRARAYIELREPPP
jgi:peptidyl-prolyl cis-trans isomerase SurA